VLRGENARALACGVPKLASCLQIANFSGHVSSFCTPHGAAGLTVSLLS
jgi:hypothetical protein